MGNCVKDAPGKMVCWACSTVRYVFANPVEKVRNEAAGRRRRREDGVARRKEARINATENQSQ
jgi:hypothetical protein